MPSVSACVELAAWTQFSLKLMRKDKLRIYVTAYLRICALEVFRKSGFQNSLVRLVDFGGMKSQAFVGFAIKGQR